MSTNGRATHTHHTTHAARQRGLRPGLIDKRLLAIFNRHPNFYDYGQYAKTFRYAAMPHAFCILAGPRTLKMACSQPIPGQAPKSLGENGQLWVFLPSQQIQRFLPVASCRPTSPAPVRVWIRPGEITNGVINPGCAALPSQSAHSKPQTTKMAAKLNDKALCSITCPALLLHDSPQRSCRIQSNGSQMVEPGTLRPVTKAGHTQQATLFWLSGNWAWLCCLLCLSVCVRVCGVGHRRRRHPGTFCLNQFPLPLSPHLEKKGPVNIPFIDYQDCTTPTAAHGSSPPIPA